MPVLYFCTDNTIQKVYYKNKQAKYEGFDKKQSFDIYLNNRQLRFYALSLLLREKSNWVPGHVGSVLKKGMLNLEADTIFNSYNEARLADRNTNIKNIID